MNSAISLLACDVGASSGRLLNIEYDGLSLYSNEISRFVTGSIKVGNSLYWDILDIYRNLIEGITKASHNGIKAVSLGIDTWGNDFVLLDKEGFLIENPYSYRDSRTDQVMPYVSQLISNHDLYLRNGIQQARMNTLYQLVSLVKDRPYIFDHAEHLLFIPDFLNYLLTGNIHSEYTLSTISQLFSYESQNWDYALIELLGIPKCLFSSIIQPGTKRGTILPSICKDNNIDTIQLITVGAHDTASAFVAVPDPNAQSIFISSGTWSIVGTETHVPVINELTLKYNFSNEGGVGGKNRLIKNVMGMWILQEIQRTLASQGRKYSFAEMSELAMTALPYGPIVDPDDACFYEPVDMPEMIQTYCRKTRQIAPETDEEIIRCVLESMALKYRYIIDKLQLLVGHLLGNIYIVSGGSQNSFLCQLTANYCQRSVYAGPVEATALGNALTQLIGLGELSDLHEARNLVSRCFPPQIFNPQKNWDNYYYQFLHITKLS